MEEHQDFVNQDDQLITCTIDDSDSRNLISPESCFIKGCSSIYPVNQSNIQATTINGGLGINDYYHDIQLNNSRFAPPNIYYHGSSSNTTCTTISFGNLHDQSHTFKAKENVGGLNEFHEVPQQVSRRNYKQAQEHLFSERKRRDKLSQCFISLYALLPQHKIKMDKATVLEDASEYIKQLQQRVKELEEIQAVNRKHIIFQKPAVSVGGKSKLCGGLGFKEDAFTSELARTSSTEDPEIVVRISGSSILVKIYCERNPSVMVLFKALITEIERLHLAFISSNVLPYSSTAVLITITAQMGTEEVLMTATDLVKYLQSALRNFT